MAMCPPLLARRHSRLVSPDAQVLVLACTETTRSTRFSDHHLPVDCVARLSFCPLWPTTRHDDGAQAQTPVSISFMPSTRTLNWESREIPGPERTSMEAPGMLHFTPA